VHTYINIKRPYDATLLPIGISGHRTYRNTYLYIHIHVCKYICRSGRCRSPNLLDIILMDKEEPQHVSPKKKPSKGSGLNLNRALSVGGGHDSESEKSSGFSPTERTLSPFRPGSTPHPTPLNVLLRGQAQPTNLGDERPLTEIERYKCPYNHTYSCMNLSTDVRCVLTLLSLNLLPLYPCPLNLLTPTPNSLNPLIC
jgi:hypothetical protein